VKVWPEKWKGALEKYRFAFLVLALGVVLLLLPTSPERTQETQAEEQSESLQIEALEHRLEEVLSKVDGAGKTRVVLTLDSGSRQVLAQDRRQDGNGGSATTVVVGQGSGTQEVVPLQTLAPDFRGALVVCPGGDDPQVKLRLLEAVSALTGLGADRISICQGNHLK